MIIQKKLIILALFVFSSSLHAQNYWKGATLKSNLSVSNNTIASTAESATLELDIKSFKEKITSAPLRFSAEAKSKSIIVDFPNPQGSTSKFSIVEAPTLSPALGARFPEIKSYAGYNIDNPSEYLRFDISPRGLHGMILSSTGRTVIINPYNEMTTEIYEVFYKKDANHDHSFTCGTEAAAKTQQTPESLDSQKNLLSTDFKTYRLALACTGEYGIYHGNDTTLVLAAMNTTMTRVNGVYEREFALTMEIIDNNDQLIYLVPNADPYSNNNGGAMLGQNQTTVNATIGAANYDIGHVFSTGGGGIAFLASVCTNNKARGVTGGGNPVGDPFDIDYVAHEMGHQFGANHTQNNSCNRVNSAAFEPGSASTIMGYAGICNPNVQNNSDDHFHIHSIYEINNHLNGTGGCAAVEIIDNTAPTIAALDDYNIPHSTPFILSADASSNENDSLTYCWEQYDNEIANMPPSSTNTDGPAFRSNSPTNNNKRYLPSLENVVNNTDNTWEVLSSVAREYTFKLSVRDNFPLAGRLSDAEMNIDVIGTAGPFLVEVPNTNVDWPALSFQTIEWDIANTDLAPINCSHVDIYLSVDGGYNYPIIVAENVPNQGYYYGMIPNNETTTARIMVKGHDNIFYDISNTNFTISAPQEGYSLWLEHPDQTACAEDTLTYFFTSIGFDGFNNPIDFQLTNQSEELTHIFESNPLTPGQNNNLFVLTPEITDNSIINWSALVTSASDQYNFETSVNGTIYPLNVDNVNLTFPENTSEDISPQLTFIWEEVANASLYTIEIATDADFLDIIVSESDLSESSFTVLSPLNNETTYYWRVVPANPCATGNTSSVYSFTTNSINCVSLGSEDLPLAIPSNEAISVSSFLSFPVEGEILDVNINSIDCEHTWINDLQIELTSPAGTNVLLLDNTCDNENDVLFSFDDEAPNQYGTWPCPPLDGLTYMPYEPLSAFDGENTQGEWTLTITDIYPQDGGFLNNWDLEICYIGNAPIAIESNVFNPTCHGSQDGAITVSPANSDDDYEYLWANGNTTNTIIGVGAGSYDVTITNGTEILVETIQLIEPDPISTQEIVIPELDNLGNGSIELSLLQGGTAPYSILWSNNTTDAIIDNITAGTYQVTITDANFCEEYFEFEVTGLESPVASFETDTESGCLPTAVQFTNLSTGDYDEILWTFEGGTPSTSTELEPSVSYEESGIFTVSLTLSNELVSATITLDDYITINDIPTVNFEVVNTGNYVFDLINTSENADTYLWDFGNGELSNEENPSMSFEFPGSYNILLVGSNPCGDDSLTVELVTTNTGQLSEGVKLDVHPNPSDGNFFLSWENIKNVETLELVFLNTLGQQIDLGLIEKPAESGLYDFKQNDLASGIYYLKVQVNSEIKIFRILIE